MVTIKIIKELSNHYIRGNLSRFSDELIKKLKKAKVNDRLIIDEKYLPQCASFAVLEDGTKITPLKVLAISTITTTNGEMLVGIYGGARKISNGTFSVTVDDTTDIVYGRLVRVTNTNSIDIINNYFLFTNSTAYPAPGGTNYSVEFFNEDFQFLGKTPLFTIKNDYSDIETGPPVITEDFTGTSDSALQLTLTMAPLYDGFTYDNSFDALNWRVSIITLNGDKQTLNGWINDGIAVISGDNHEILTITYNEIATHWLVGVSFIWCANSRKKINETYSYPPSGGVGPKPIDITPTDPTEAGGNGSASFDVDTGSCTGVSTASLDPANGTTPITLSNGANTGVIFDDLPPDDYTLNVYCDDTLIATGDFTINDFVPEPPEVVITNVVPTDVTTNGGTDGTITFDVEISNFVDTPTVVLNPANGTTAITLTDGTNTGVSFDTVPAGTYTIEVYDGDTLVNSEAGVIVSEPDAPTGSIDNIVPTSPTTEGGTDGAISFDANSTGCTGDSTAVLNPASGTTPITLTDGNNTGLTFSPLPAGDYTIQIYCDDTLVDESETITIPDFVTPATAEITNTVPTAPTTTGGADGSIDFDVTTDGCDGVQTAVLNPASGTTPITLTTGANTGLTFEGLTPDDYTIQIYCDSALIEESDTITVPDFVAPTGDITNIVPTAPTTADNDDGEISFDTDVTGCTGAKTAVLNPAAGTTPITLVDGTNTGISFSPLPAGDYTIQIYCDDTLIDESDTVTIPVYTTPVTADITNIIPNAPTTEGGTDGTINFAVETDGCDGVQTAVLNPAAGTTAITLEDGANTGLVFEDLPPDTYTIQVYCDATLIGESGDIIVPDYTVPNAEIIDVLTPTDGDLIPPDSTDIPVNDGSDLSHKLLMTNGSFKPDEGIQCYQNLFIIGSEFTAEEWTAACLNTYNPDDPQDDKCFLAIKRKSDNTLDLLREEDADSIDGLTWIKAIDNITVNKILPNTALNAGDTFTLTDDYTNYDFIISKWYFSTGNDSTVGPQYGYPIRDVSDLAITSTWMQKQHESNTDFNGILDMTGPLNGRVTKAHDFDFLATMVGVKGFPTPVDLNISLSGTTITADDYADADFLVVNSTYSGTGNTQLMYAKEIVYDGITRYDFIGLGACYFSFNADKTINVIDSALGATIVITSIKKIVLT